MILDRALSRLIIVLPLLILAGCGSSNGADGIGRGDSCYIRDSSHANGDHEVGESVCETNSGFLAPDVASMFVFLHDRSVSKDPSNLVMRYEVVCPDTGACDYAPPKVKWITPSSLLVTLATYGDIYCLQKVSADNISITYGKTPLRSPPQDAFTSVDGLCS